MSQTLREMLGEIKKKEQQELGPAGDPSLDLIEELEDVIEQLGSIIDRLRG